MKKRSLFTFSCLLVIIFLASICTSVHSQEWHVANQVTITWDAVTTLENNATIPEGNVIEYPVWLVNADTDPDKVNPVAVGTTSETLYVITLGVEGRYFVGLQTVRRSSEGIFLGESCIGWTDDPVIAANGDIFGLQYFVPPANAFGVGVLR